MSSLIGFNQYDALPGHQVGFKDKQVKLPRDTEPKITESILFIGTATDGPVNQPIRVTPDNVYSIFGKAAQDNGLANGATLINAFEEAWLAGARDIRLMRYSGIEATAALKAKSYQNTNIAVRVQEFLAPGNSESDFTLPHGNINPVTFQVYAAGQVVAPENYVLVEGSNDGTTLVQATLTILENATNMNAEITVTYSYDDMVADGDGVFNPETVRVVENNTDANGDRMVTAGEDTVFALESLPRQGVRLYANDVEIVDPQAFTVNGQQLVLHSTSGITKGAYLKASYSYASLETIEPKINLRSTYGGSNYNNCTYAIEKDANGIVTVIIEKPANKKAVMNELPIKIRSIEFPNLQLFANAINSHPFNRGVIEASVDSAHQFVLTSDLEPTTKTFFTGGSDEINLSREDIFERLGGKRDAEGYVDTLGSYQVLENYTVDYVVPLGVYADESLPGIYDNFAYQLALACAVMSHYNSVTMGLISTTSPASTSLRAIEDHVRKLEAIDNTFYMRDVNNQIITDGEGNQIDLGQFISIVAGPETVTLSTRLGYIANNTPAAIGATVAGLDITSAPTNKPIASADGLRFEFSSSQLNRLTKARYITVKRKSDGTIAIVDAMTAAAPDSDYTRLSTARVIKEAANQVRVVADPFIGEPNDTANRNALAAALDKRLGKMVEAGVLETYRFDIIASAQMELMGEAQIELSIKAKNELRKITTIVGLQA